jgi:hypothetical protein
MLGRRALLAATNGRSIDPSLLLDLDAGDSASYPGTGTTWTDLSGKGRNGTITSPSYSASDGGSIVFNGTSTRVDYSLIAISNFTCVSWFKPAINNEYQEIFAGSDGASGPNNNQLRLAPSGAIEIALNNAGVSLSPSTSGQITAGAWHQIAWVRSGSSISIYKNGTAISSGSSSAQLTLVNIGAQFIIGSPAFFFKGHLSVARIYDRALSAAEVSQDFNALRGRYGI